MSNQEGIEHWSHKAMIRKHLETGLSHRGGLFLAANEENCRSCDGGLLPINMLEGVLRVGEVETPFRYGSWDFIPDIMLWGRTDRKPLAFVEIVHTSPPSPEKVAFCQREGIDLYVFDARAPIANHFQTRLLWGKSPALRCRRRQRDRLKTLTDHLYRLPADKAIVGVKNHYRAGKTGQTYLVGEKTVNASELTAVVVLHAMMMQLEANDRTATTLPNQEHGDASTYTQRECLLARQVKNVVNAVQWENVAPGDQPHSGKPDSVPTDAWLLPKAFWNAPEPPPLW